MMPVRDYGSKGLGEPLHRDVAKTSAAQELTDVPQPKLLGTISEDILTKRHPSFEEDGPPPWEVDPKWHKQNADARRFITCPDTWELRWLSPRRIQAAGLRDWSPVMAYDERVTVKISAMVSPEHYVRRGGRDGDILCFMPKHWVESRVRIKAEEVRRRTNLSIERQAQTVEEVNRGHFGPRIHVDSAIHPTHTIASSRRWTRTHKGFPCLISVQQLTLPLGPSPTGELIV